MLQYWNKNGKSGDVVYPEGEVVTQTQGIVKMPIYVTQENGSMEPDKWYIEVDGKLQEVLYNTLNGYCYRQDGL